MTKQLQERVAKTRCLPPEAAEIHRALNPCTRAAPILNSRALTIADDAITGFFSSLTNDFLSPVHHWVASVLSVAQLEPFQLCRMPLLPLPAGLLASQSVPLGTPSTRLPMGGGVSLFSREAFLVYLHANRKTNIVSLTFRDKLSYPTY